MKAFLTNLSQLFHINGLLKKEVGEGERWGWGRETAFIRDFVTYLVAIKYIYVTYAILMKLIEESVPTLYF